MLWWFQNLVGMLVAVVFPFVVGADRAHDQVAEAGAQSRVILEAVVLVVSAVRGIHRGSVFVLVGHQVGGDGILAHFI